MEEKEMWTDKMAMYQAKARQADLETQKVLFWKHIIITALVCFAFCFALYQANDYFSEHIVIESETHDNGDINLSGNIIGGING